MSAPRIPRHRADLFSVLECLAVVLLVGAVATDLFILYLVMTKGWPK